MTESSTRTLDRSKVYVVYCDGIGCNGSTKGAYKLSQLRLPDQGASRRTRLVATRWPRGSLRTGTRRHSPREETGEVVARLTFDTERIGYIRSVFGDTVRFATVSRGLPWLDAQRRRHRRATRCCVLAHPPIVSQQCLISRRLKASSILRDRRGGSAPCQRRGPSSGRCFLTQTAMLPFL